MARPVSGETKASVVRIKQKNGDYYVYDCKRKYDPEVRYTRRFDYKLTGKIKAGTTEVIPTRSRRKPEEQDADNKPAAVEEVEWGHTGATDILEWIGSASGIDEDIYKSLDKGMGDKVITIARYVTANPSDGLGRLTKWQRTHPAPCQTELNKKNRHVMREELGVNKAAHMAYFQSRARRAGDSDVLAIDSTTVSTYSENLKAPRQGFNKANDGLPTIKLLTAYSLKIKQPIAVTVQPGNIPDVKSIENCLKELNWLHASSYKVVTDNGFYSWDNVARYVKNNIKFLTRIKKDISWVKAEINAHREEWFSPNAIDRKQTGLHGITLMINKDISWVRMRTCNGKEKGKTEKKTVRLYLHIFLDRNKVADEQDTLIKRLNYIREQLESGITEFKQDAQNLIDTYIIVKKRGSKITTTIREDAWKEAQKNFGIFALLSNKKTETFEALYEYRLREKIEEAYRLQKSQPDGKRTRVWYDDNYMGRVFCQMVALGYQLYFREAILRVKKLLAERQDSDTESTWKTKEALKKWLNQSSEVEILDWFDSIEETRARRDSDKLALKTELTVRDNLFLELLMSPTKDIQNSAANEAGGTEKQDSATSDTDTTEDLLSAANDASGTERLESAASVPDTKDTPNSVTEATDNE